MWFPKKSGESRLAPATLQALFCKFLMEIEEYPVGRLSRRKRLGSYFENYIVLVQRIAFFETFAVIIDAITADAVNQETVICAQSKHLFSRERVFNFHQITCCETLYVVSD